MGLMPVEVREGNKRLDERDVILKAEGLSFAYDKEKHVLEDVSFDIGNGEIFSILGPNGSGKTTLLKCLNGLLEPSSGSIRLKDIEVTELSSVEIARHMAYVPQVHRPVFSYTVLDVVLMGRNPYIGDFSVPSGEDIEIAGNKLEILGISYLKDRYYTDLSGGEIQLVLIARALAQEPEVLLLDEPISHLDFRNQIHVMKVVRKLSEKEGITVVMSMHDPNYSMIFSDRVMYLKSGKLLGIDEPRHGISKKCLEKLYNVQIDLVPVNGFNWIVPSHRALS